MACATLKRSLDWEAMNQRPTKRRRCNPFAGSGSASPSGASSSNASQAGCSRTLIEPAPSAFADTTCPKLTPEKMAQNIREEITRLHRSKQLIFNSGAIERMQDSDHSGSEMGPDSPRRPDTPPRLLRNVEKGLFSFKEVQLICASMLKEQEDNLREQYDTVLTNKLAEQYDAFVKFTYDQIQRRYEAAPSYLS